MLTNKRWWKAAAIRVIKTFAEAMIPLIAVQVSIAEVQWSHVFGVAATSAVICFLTCLAGLPEVEEGEHE